jgi:hypothetical protein
MSNDGTLLRHTQARLIRQIRTQDTRIAARQPTRIPNFDIESIQVSREPAISGEWWAILLLPKLLQRKRGFLGFLAACGGQFTGL